MSFCGHCGFETKTRFCKRCGKEDDDYSDVAKTASPPSNTLPVQPIQPPGNFNITFSPVFSPNISPTVTSSPNITSSPSVSTTLTNSGPSTPARAASIANDAVLPPAESQHVAPASVPPKPAPQWWTKVAQQAGWEFYLAPNPKCLERVKFENSILPAIYSAHFPSLHDQFKKFWIQEKAERWDDLEILRRNKASIAVFLNDTGKAGGRGLSKLLDIWSSKRTTYEYKLEHSSLVHDAIPILEGTSHEGGFFTPLF